jgi:hypothetical protein
MQLSWGRARVPRAADGIAPSVLQIPSPVLRPPSPIRWEREGVRVSYYPVGEELNVGSDEYAAL